MQVQKTSDLGRLILVPHSNLWSKLRGGAIPIPGQGWEVICGGPVVSLTRLHGHGQPLNRTKVVWTVMQEGARVCYSVSGLRFPNEITLVARRRPLQVNHVGSESCSILHIKLLLTAAQLPMIINHSIQHWPQEVPRLGICCIAGIQSQRHAAWIKVQVKLMQFFTKLQVFSDNISRFKREKSFWCWRICDPSSSLPYNRKALYTYFTQGWMVIKNATQGKIRPWRNVSAKGTYQSEPLKYFSSHNKGYTNAHRIIES